MTVWKKPKLDDNFAKAINLIQKRAEKQRDWGKIIETYAETDLAFRASTRDSQLVLGRRGTGKTHMFLVLEEKLGVKGEVTHYIDCRTLGSGLNISIEKPEQTATKFFRSLLNDIGTSLFDKTIRLETPIENIEKKTLNTLIGLTSQMEPSITQDRTTSTFNYRQITESLQATINYLQISLLTLIIDEWVSIPPLVQPYVAEYIKRTIMTIPEICIKLLAVNYQFKLSIETDAGTIGLKRGADIPDVLDFDTYLIYDENPVKVTEFFSEVLYNHLGVELNWELTIPREEKAKRIIDIFTQKNSFIELVRAAEGNCRDFLCIFSRAFWEEYRQQKGAKAISILHIRNAAADWYDNEKYSNIKDEPILNKTLTFIMDNIIKGFKTRIFMVETSKAQSTVIIRLLNERILHKLPGFYSHKDRPGERYELFNIDYGVYVRFKGTIYDPNIGKFTKPKQIRVGQEYQMVLPLQNDVVQKPIDENQLIVPQSDKRSIRRIVFDPDNLKITTWSN